MQVDYDQGWPLWSDAIRYYPSAVHRRIIIRSWLKPLAPTSILDVGCGTGALLAVLQQAFPGAWFAGVDNAELQIARNRRVFPWSRFEVLDIAQGALAAEYNTVICSEVLEHVQEDGLALDNLCAMAGRYLLLTVPTGKIHALERGFGHLRHYSLETLCGRLERRGFRVVRAMAWGFPFMNLFKWASNLKPDVVLSGFGAGKWSLPKKILGALLTGLFYLNWGKGPQLFMLAERIE